MNKQPVWVPQTKKAAILAAISLMLATSIPITLVGFALADSRASGRNDEILKRDVKNCEADKLDRIDAASGFTEIAASVSERSVDKNLPESERKRSAESSKRYRQRASSLRSRLILCKPYVYDDKEVIDPSALLKSLNVESHK